MTRAKGKNVTRHTTQEFPGPDSGYGRSIGESLRQDPNGGPINSETGNVTNAVTFHQDVLSEPYTRDEYGGFMAHGVPADNTDTEDRAKTERGSNARKIPQPDLGGALDSPMPIPVYITEAASGSRALTTMATNRITAPATGTEAARMTARDDTRRTMYVLVEPLGNLVLTPPSVPATTVAKQNTNAYPVQVVIAANGATITAVTVNGVTVGSGAGTYTVPAYGAISMTYSVATPTWTWTGLGVSNAGVRIDHEVSTLDTSGGALYPPGSYTEIKGCQDELFMVSADANTPVVSVMYIYELAGAA